MASASDRSGAEARQDGLTRMPLVGELATANYIQVARRHRVVEVARQMAERWISSVLVVEARRPVGILTKRTIIHDVLAQGYTGVEMTAGEIMHSPIITIRADATADEAAAMITRTGLRHLAVVRDGELVGVLSHYHLARILPELVQMRETAKAGSPEKTD